MTGEQIFRLLEKMAARGDSPRKREQRLRHVAKKEGMSSDALRARARRYARRMGLDYPTMRERPSPARERDRRSRRAARAEWRAERLRVGAEALARGADWAEIARLFGIRTPEGAAQWWRRNQPESTDARRSRRRAEDLAAK